MAESEEGMREMIKEQGTMYDSVEAVHNLNSVEGFNPRSFMRIIQGEGESAKYYLDVAFRKLWFRLKYLEGRISKRLLKLENDMAVIEARVYLNYRDAEDQFVANAFSHKFRADDSQFGSKYVELAETAATGRALADAGFGLQFADCEKETDPEVADAPFESRFLQGEGDSKDCAEGMTPGAMEVAGMISAENNLPGQKQIEEYLDVPPMMRETTSAMQQHVPEQRKTPTSKGSETASVSQKNTETIDKKLPVE